MADTFANFCIAQGSIAKRKHAANALFLNEKGPTPLLHLARGAGDYELCYVYSLSDGGMC